MSRDLSEIVANALGNEVLDVFFAVVLEFDSGTLRFWTGVGEKVIDGETYIGTGSLLGLSDMEETAELAAAGATITLSGIPAEVLALALDEPYQSRPARIFFGLLHDPLAAYALPDGAVSYQPIAVFDAATQSAWASPLAAYALPDGAISYQPIAVFDAATQSAWRSTINDTTFMSEVFTATMDSMNIVEGAETATVELAIENRLLDLERARIRRYTNSDQQSRFPGDRGLEFIDDLQDREIFWGRTPG